MKLVDSPTPGWYPDPDRASHLRWWGGADWTDDRRPKPTAADLFETESAAQGSDKPGVRPSKQGQDLAASIAADTAGTARAAARVEIDRAAQEVSREFQDFITRVHEASFGYLSPILRWIRIGVILAAVLVVAWFAIQFIAQMTLFDWVGDRIDNVTDGSG